MKINKILYYSSFVFSDEQGCSINELEFCKEFVNTYQGNAWLILSYKNKFLDENPEFPLGIKNILFFKNSRLINIIASFIASYQINRVLKRHQIPLVVTRILEPPTVIFFLIHFFKVKVAIKTAGTTYLSPKPYSFREKIYTKLEYWLRKSVLESALAIDVPTIELCELVLKEAPKLKNIHVVPNSTNINRFRILDKEVNRSKYGLVNTDIVLGFVGAAPSEDGAMEMILVAQNILKRYPQIKVVIAGEDKGIQFIRSIVEQKKMIKSVFFLGRIPYQDIPSLISTFDIGFSLVPNHLLKRNGNSSQKVRQYLSCGVPVVSVAPGHEFIDEHTFLGATVNPEDLQDIEEKTIKILDSLKNDFKKRRLLIRQYATEHLSTKKTFQQRLEFWESLLKD